MSIKSAISFAEYANKLKYNCNRGKHKPYVNSFGVTWCVCCGSIMKDCVPVDKDTHLPVNTNEPLIISNNNEEN